MSEATGADLLPATGDPVHVAARRLRWFRTAFRGYLDHLEGEMGCTFDLDEGRLAEAFVAWLRAVEVQRPADPAARKAYFEFAAGLMLRELVKAAPVRMAAAPTRAAPDSAAAFWPEGYACTMFCLFVVRAALRQEFAEDVGPAPEALDLRNWWSFRENAREDPTISVAFLDLFLGHEPEWFTPGLFSARLRRELGRPSAPGDAEG